MKLRLVIHFQMRNLKLKVINKSFRKDRDAVKGGLLFYVNEKLNCRSLEICPPNVFIEILPLELRLLNSKWFILGTYKPPSQMNQPISLKFKNYLHIFVLHMITFYYWETLICHFLIKI